MTGSERRDAIIRTIQKTHIPVSGKSLAASYDVAAR